MVISREGVELSQSEQIKHFWHSLISKKPTLSLLSSLLSKQQQQNSSEAQCFKVNSELFSLKPAQAVPGDQAALKTTSAQPRRHLLPTTAHPERDGAFRPVQSRHETRAPQSRRRFYMESEGQPNYLCEQSPINIPAMLFSKLLTLLVMSEVKLEIISMTAHKVVWSSGSSMPLPLEVTLTNDNCWRHCKSLKLSGAGKRFS